MNVTLLQKDDGSIQRHKELYWLSRSPTSCLRERSSVYSSVECSEVLTMGYARRVKEVGEWRGTARMKSRESVPLNGSPGRPYIESEGQVTDRDGFSQLSGREPKGGETSKLVLQGRPSCPGVSARPVVVVIIVLCPYHGMGWRGTTVPVVAAL